MERKLVAIFSADVQGYSRLMGEDEEGTIRTLTTYREVIATLIQQYRGRVVDAPGDNLLAEFASAVDAVQGALAMQQELRVRNALLPAHRQMIYRIGINVGDVVVEGALLYGDGVNIAARLESLADGGGLCISGTVYDQIANKLAVPCTYLGAHRVKNIKQPVRVYRIETEPQLSAPTVHASGMEEPDTPATLLRGVIQQGQHAWAPSFARSRIRRWLPRQVRLHWRGAMAFLATGAAVLTLTFVAKVLSVPKAPAVASGVVSPIVQDQQRTLRSGTPPVPLKADLHRSYESTPAQGQQSMPMLDKGGRPVGVYTASHALVVGLSTYTYGWTPAPGVKDDVQAVTQTLEKHGFHVVVVMDPTMAELEEAHRDFIGKYGFAPDNRLLLYYAGTGYTVKPAYALQHQGDWMGYLVTRDTPLPTVDPEGFRRHALSMERFASLAREMQVRHALFVFDTCFSGTIALALARSHPTSPPGPTPPEITAHMMEPVRQFISAGTADQKVPDVSIFRRLFVEALEGAAEADRNSDGYVTGSELGQFLQEKVTMASQGAQTPQYGKMSDPRLSRGEFVFTAFRTLQSPALVTLPLER
jgi:class 3 adenylate cyclase